MADSFTANLNLTKPEVGSSRDTWGGKLNVDLDSIDGVFAAAGTGTSVGLKVGFGKTLNAADGTVIIPSSIAPAQTADGSMVWDSDDNLLTVGDGAGRKILADITSAQTLTNKTLTSPVVNTPVLNGSGGLLTLPAGPDTLVGRATTDTLTNKTINGSNNTLTNVSLTTGVTGTLPVANGGSGATALAANNVLLGNGTSALQVVAPGTTGNILTSNGTTWSSAAPPSGIPSQTGNAGKLLSTNGTSASWSTDSVVRARGSLSALSSSPTVGTGAVNISSVTAGAAGVYTVNFSSALPNTNYQVLATVNQGSGTNDNIVVCQTKNTGSFILTCFRASTGAAAATVAIDVVVYGGW